MGTVVAVANQKGGVAKTTTVAALAAVLAERGRKVAVIDLDPQGALTWSLGVEGDGLALSVGDVLLGRCEVSDALLDADGVQLVPARSDLVNAEVELATSDRPETALRSALTGMRDRFHWILIDCPPSLGVLTQNALVAADEVIIPLQCEALGLRSAEHVVAAVRDVQRCSNADLRIRGVIPTMYDKRAYHPREVLRRAREELGLPVLAPPVPRSVRVAEAPDLAMSLLVHAGASKPAKAYRALAKELDRSRRRSSNQGTRSSKGNGRAKK